jgi:hypothetical protein
MKPDRFFKDRVDSFRVERLHDFFGCYENKLETPQDAKRVKQSEPFAESLV